MTSGVSGEAAFTVNWCPPDPELGIPLFRSGRAQFTVPDVIFSLTYESFPDGLLLRSDGQYWRVDRTRHVLVACDEGGRPVSDGPVLRARSYRLINIGG